MAYTAKCDTASATKWWITGTGSSVNRLSEVMDDNASGVEENDNPGNYQPWSTFMTETVEDGVYLIHLNFEIGDGSTATTLTSLNEQVYFDGCAFSVRWNGVLTLGALKDDWGWKGSCFYLNQAADSILTSHSNSTLNLYDSEIRLVSNNYMKFNAGFVTGRNFKISATDAGNQRVYFFANTSIDFKKGFFSGWAAVNYYKNPTNYEDIHTHGGWQGAIIQASATLTRPTITSSGAQDIWTTNTGTITTLVSPNFVPVVGNNTATNECHWKEIVNIKVADKDGTALQNVVVDCVGSESGSPSTEYDTAQWTAGTVTTAADGTITEQTVTAKKWVGTLETETNYNYFKFTFSLAGYETLVMENITIDGPIDWHLELQSQKQPPAPWQEGLM